MKIVEVEWVDAIGLGGWRKRTDVLEEYQPGALRHRTVGYVIRDDEAGLVVAASYSEEWDDKVADSTFIPRAAVAKVTELRLSKATPQQLEGRIRHYRAMLEGSGYIIVVDEAYASGQRQQGERAGRIPPSPDPDRVTLEQTEVGPRPEPHKREPQPLYPGGSTYPTSDVAAAAADTAAIDDVAADAATRAAIDRRLRAMLEEGE